ncbi:hypothetical protein BVG19_g243 [[Candida] boidinii]|nr:hypothetical protein BVG19_g243 [[Candida] boidinii]OWB49772.1 hypothetical protein B5S27_g1316 [[Candida] boidinii]
MGAELSLLAPTAPTIGISAYIDSLNNIQYSKPIGTSRFLKTIKCLDQSGQVIVKLLIKPTTVNTITNSNNGQQFASSSDASINISPVVDSNGDIRLIDENDNEIDALHITQRQKVTTIASDGLNLSVWVSKLEKLKSDLTDIPNALPYIHIIDSERAGYLIRPFMSFDLHERISLRPFLESIEKKWIVFQLLSVLSKCHAKNVFHGDIKSENVLLTSWSWVQLTDFAIFKPVVLPEDNPSQFTFYFDTSQRYTCYVAPERFSPDNQEITGSEQLTAEMDIFSLGCVIAELYLEGLPLFTLPQLFKYKRGEYQPNLDFIDDLNLRKLILSMISLDPKKRLNAQDYLKKYRKSFFPDHFYTFLYPYMRKLSVPNSASKANTSRLHEFDYKIDQIYKDFDNISFYLGFKQGIEEIDRQNASKKIRIQKETIPLGLNLPGMNNHIPQSTSKIFGNGLNRNDCSSLVLLDLVLHSIRNTTRSSYRVKACYLILAFAEQIHDEGKLDRCLPYLISVLDDPSEDVKVTALKCITQLLCMVDAISPVNNLIFSDYIIPKLEKFKKQSYNLSNVESREHSDQGSYVRSVFAACLPHLAHCANKFSQMALLLKRHVQSTSYGQNRGIEKDDDDIHDSVFNIPIEEISKRFELLATSILTDSEPNVRIALLENISPLCAFFGKENTNNIILSHLLTYLNDRSLNSSKIRLAFVESILSISIFVGVFSLEEYMLPLLIQTLYDPDESVVVEVLRVFTELTKLGLIEKNRLWDIIRSTAKLLLHPNQWIRQSTLCLIIAVSENITLADIYCMLYPLIRPFFQYEVADFSWETLFACTHKPINRSVFNLAKKWSLTKDDTLFWEIVPHSSNQMKSNPYGNNNTLFLTKTTAGSMMYKLNHKGADDSIVADNAEIPLSQNDLQFVERLKSSGLLEKDLWKIATFRNYIYKMARTDNGNHNYGKLSYEPQTADGAKFTTIFFDIKHKSEPRQTKMDKTQGQPSPLTSSVTIGNKRIAASEFNQALLPPVVNKSKPSKSPLLFGEIQMSKPLVSTNEELAFGDTTSVTSGTNNYSNDYTPHQFNDESLKYQKMTTSVKHSYTDNNPYVLEFLNNIKFEAKLENYPEFGNILRNILDRNTVGDFSKQRSGTENFEPKGLLVAKLLEHKSCINCVAVSPDQKIFITGDDLGLLKFWNTERLEKNVTGLSMLSTSLGSSIKSISFIHNRNCFAVSTMNGYIKIFRIDYVNNDLMESSKSPSLSRFASKSSNDISLTLIRHYYLDAEDEYALNLQFSVKSTSPYLIFSTCSSKIMVLDIRTLKIVKVLQNDLRRGIPTTFVVDANQSWILVGTSRGFLDLWNLQLELHLKSVKFQHSSFPVKKISILPDNRVINGRKVSSYVSVIGCTGVSDVTIWDVSKLSCRQVFSTSTVNNVLTNYALNEVPDSYGNLASRIQELKIEKTNAIKDDSCTALTLVSYPGFDNKNHLNIVFATPNLKIINWNVNSPDDSSVVIKSKANNLKKGDDKTPEFDENLHLTPVFTSTQINPNLTFITERYVENKPARGQLRNRNSRVRGEQMNNNLINKSSVDVITDLATVNYPYDMIIATDRSGVINVYR